MQRVTFYTLGCKLNFAETGTIRESFEDRQFQTVPFGEAADIAVINTCTVTEEADRKCRQVIRRALKANPEAFIIVTGCYAQLQPETIASIEGVQYINRNHPNAHIWMGACDEELTAKSYIVPGLGDAGDLSFGMKIQD